MMSFSGWLLRSRRMSVTSTCSRSGPLSPAIRQSTSDSFRGEVQARFDVPARSEATAEKVASRSKRRVAEEEVEAEA
jgi:hypothetical protein